MASFNKLIILGNLTADPELKQTQGGLSVCSFTVAVNRPRAQSGDIAVDYIDCVAWRKSAEFVAQYFRKGDNIIAEGPLQMRDWTDKNGNKRRAYELQCSSVAFGGNKSANKPTEAQESAEAANYSADNIPTAYGGNSAQYEEIQGEEQLPF
jgi:single-strand DNA-binding protein